MKSELIGVNHDAPKQNIDTLKVTVLDDQVTLRNHERRQLFTNCYAGIELSDGKRFTTEGMTSINEQTDEDTLLNYRGDETRPGFVWRYHTHSEKRMMELQLNVVNTTNNTLAIKSMDILVVPEGFLHIPADKISVSQMGYQAQSPIHPPKPLTQHEFREYTLASPPSQVGPMKDPEIEQSAVAPWMTRIHTPEGDKALVGFASCRKFVTAFSFQPSEIGHRMKATNDAEDTLLYAGEQLDSESILIITGHDEIEMLKRYAKTTAKKMQGVPRKKNINGWGSWYREHPPQPNITEDIVIKNIDAVANLHDALPLEFIQIDDGYFQEIGQWDTNDKFPSGHNVLVRTVEDHGYKAGTWIVPFVASDQSWVFQNHPEWFIQNDEDKPKVAKYHSGWQRNLYVLDPTNPDAVFWQGNEFKKLKGAGYSEFKTDFSYLTATKGKAYDQTSTTIERNRLALQLARDVFDEAVVLGCQGPHGTSLGFVNANRIGHDINAIWDRGDTGAHSSLKHAIIATQQAWWMNGTWWQNDPDCILAREHNSDLSYAETQSWLTTVLLANGVFTLGDDLTELEPERLLLVKTIFDLQKKLGTRTGIPIGPYTSDGLSERMLVKPSHLNEELIGALFNWDDTEKSLTFDPSGWNIPQHQKYTLENLWTNEIVTSHESMSFPDTAPHGVALFSVKTS